jgi:hypothetical protein
MRSRGRQKSFVVLDCRPSPGSALSENNLSAKRLRLFPRTDKRPAMEWMPQPLADRTFTLQGL